MNLPRFLQRRNPGRELSQLGHEKRRRTVRETTRRIREELVLPEDPRLG